MPFGKSYERSPRFKPYQRTLGRVAHEKTASPVAEPERHGNRGKRWASQLSRLLENMLELDDSRPFREPVDCHRYPDFYSMTTDPPDLSKVQLNFHAGKYSNPEDIARDIRRMLQENMTFFRNRDERIYEQANRLSWWFETEIRVILGKYGRLPYDSSQAANVQLVDQGRANDKLSPLLPVTTLSLSASDRSTSLSASHVSSRNTSKQKNVIVISEANVPVPASSFQATPARQTVSVSESSKKNNGDSDIRAKPTIIPINSVKDQPQVTRTSSTEETSRSATNNVLTSTSVMSKTDADSTWQSRSSRASLMSADTGSDAVTAVTCMLNVSALWCGELLVQPANHIALSQDGFIIPLKIEGRDLMFAVSVRDIVRCCIDKSRGRRHHLFVFVRPSCTETLLGMLGGDSVTVSSGMLIMDMELTSATQLSRLVHIFWAMGSLSVFGPLFSEIDCETSQELLASNRSYVETRPAGLVAVRKESTGSTSFAQLVSTAAEKTTPTNGSSPRSASKKRGLEAAVAKLSANAAAAASSSVDVDDNVVVIIDECGGKGDEHSGTIVKVASSQGLGRTATNTSANVLTTLLASLTRLAPGKSSSSKDVSPLSPAFVLQNHVDEDVDLHSGLNGDLPVDDDVVMTGAQRSLRCPITQRLMREPVRNNICHHSYDRAGVSELIRQRGHKAKCPVQGCSNTLPLRLDDIEPDRYLVSILKQQSDGGGSKR